MRTREIESKHLPGYQGRSGLVTVWRITNDPITATSIDNMGRVTLTARDNSGHVVDQSHTSTSTMFDQYPDARVDMPIGGWVREISSAPGRSSEYVILSTALWATIEATLPQRAELSACGLWVLASMRRLNSRGRKDERSHDPESWEVGQDECLQLGYTIPHGKGLKLSKLGRAISHDAGDPWTLREKLPTSA